MVHKIQSGIDRRLPNNLLAPLSVILGNAELLADSEKHVSDPVQVRGIARTIRRAAFRLTHLVRSYLLYINLEPVLLDPLGKERLLLERAPVCQTEVEDLLHDLAREWGREEDFHVSIQDVVLHISEAVFFSLLEELTDQALRQSRAGVRVTITGKSLPGVYRLEVITQGSTDPASLLLAIQEETPLGLLLARRIVEIYGGQLSLADTPEGDSRIVLEFPRPIG
jgi:signal transduction histidine kinase